jgi:hypothetical protein
MRHLRPGPVTKRLIAVALIGALLTGLGVAPPAGAERPLRPPGDFERSANMRFLGHSPYPNTADPFTANSDLAFWGRYAFQGHYNGFRIVDVSSPRRPRQIAFQECFGDQGDVVVWGHILVRSWNSPAPGHPHAAGQASPAQPPAERTCDGQAVPEGFEGLHVFDISNLRDPELVASVPTECGSHTATLAPDPRHDRVVVYNNVSSGCDWIDIVEVPISDPAGARLIGMEPLEGPFTEGVAPGCHDMGVILGDANLAACASADATNVFDIGRNALPGGSLDDPELLYTIREPGVGDQTQGSGRWHSASFTWDGEVIILGWEPGGGGEPRCTETGTVLPGGVVQTDTHKTMFFYDASTGAKLGQWVLPRPQTIEENCTIHNYNVVPLAGRYVVVSGNYQSGISVVDFTDPAEAVEIAYADPAPVVPTQTAGDWSTYWYNGRIYESDITRGLLIWSVHDRRLGRARPLHHLNPQTQERTLR